MSRRKKNEPGKKVDPKAPGDSRTPCRDLRRVEPVRRMRGQVEVISRALAKHRATLSSWALTNQLAQKAGDVLALVADHIALFDNAMSDLGASGFSPPRKTFTALTKKGDRVRVLEEHRSFYSDLVDPDLMLNLVVVRKPPGKGGGLVVEALDGRKMRVAIAHVVRLT